MAKDIDILLSQLAAAPEDRSLAALEPQVWRRIEARRRTENLGGGLRLQLAVAVGALVMGAAIAGVSQPRAPVASEMVVLSEDAALAPSVVVTGGA